MATSVTTDKRSEFFKIDVNAYTKSAKGGGIAPMLTHMGTCELAVYNPADDAPNAKLVESEAEKGKDGEDRLRAQCHCGGVSFTIPRPTQAVMEDSFLARAVSPLDKKKWKATLDACDDCRLTTGEPIVSWAFVPLSSCEPRIDVSLRIGTAKTYSSSEGVLRSFCSVCGATVFFSKKSRQPMEEQAIVDVAMGILRAPEGVMVEDWLTWRSRVAFAPSG